jgi:acetyltransferase-like isoleucine patch superfamily enzyme
MNHKKIIKNMLSPFMKFRHGIQGGKRIYIAKGVKITKPRQIKIDDDVNIRSYSTIMCVSPNAQIVFETGVDIGMFSRVTAATKIYLGKNVLTGPNVFITDHNHKYTDIDTAIMYQGIELPHSVEQAGGGSDWRRNMDRNKYSDCWRSLYRQTLHNRSEQRCDK